MSSDSKTKKSHGTFSFDLIRVGLQGLLRTARSLQTFIYCAKQSRLSTKLYMMVDKQRYSATDLPWSLVPHSSLCIRTLAARLDDEQCQPSGILSGL